MAPTPRSPGGGGRLPAEAVAARIADGEDLPAPSALRRGHASIAFPPLLAYKAALFGAMRRARVSKSALARRLGVDEKDVRRLLDPRYRGSKVERLHAALAACGVAARLTLVAAGGGVLGASARSEPADPHTRARDAPRGMKGNFPGPPGRDDPGRDRAP